MRKNGVAVWCDENVGRAAEGFEKFESGLKAKK